MSSTTTRSLIGSEDINHLDGVNDTFIRLTSTGGTVTLNKFGLEVNAAEAYGAGTISFTALKSAIDAIGTTNKRTVVLKHGTWPISADLTIPSNITLKPMPGAILTPATGKTLTINGPIEAGPWQIFSWAGTGAIDLSECPTSLLYWDWWGTTSGYVADNAASLQKAHDSNISGKRLRISPGYWRIASTVTFSGTWGFTLEGTGERDCLIFVDTGATDGIRIGLQGIVGEDWGSTDRVYYYYLKDFMLVGEATACRNGIVFSGVTHGGLTNVGAVLGSTGYAFVLAGPEHSDSYITVGLNSDLADALPSGKGLAAGGIRVCPTYNGWNTSTYNKLKVQKSGSYTADGAYGVKLETVGDNFELTGTIENCPGTPGYALYATDCHSTWIHDLHIETVQSAILLERCLRMNLDNVTAASASQVSPSESFYDAWKAAGGVFMIDTGVWTTSYTYPNTTTLKSCTGTVIRRSNLGVLRIEPSCSNTTVDTLSLNEVNGLQDYGSDTQYLGGPFLTYSYKPMKTAAIYGENRDNLFTNVLMTRWTASLADGWSGLSNLTMEKSGTGGGAGLVLNHSTDYCAKFLTTGATGEVSYALSAEQRKAVLGSRINLSFWGNFPTSQTWTTRAGLFFLNVTVPDWTDATVFKEGDGVNVTAAFLAANPTYAGATQWVCTTAGTSDATEPVWSNSSHQESTATDGTVTWTAVSLNVNNLPTYDWLTAYSDGLWHKYSIGTFVPWNATAVSFVINLYRQPAAAETTFYLAEPSLHIGATASRGVQPGKTESPSFIQVGAVRLWGATPTAGVWIEAGDVDLSTGQRCTVAGAMGTATWANFP